MNELEEKALSERMERARESLRESIAIVEELFPDDGTNELQTPAQPIRYYEPSGGVV